MFNAEMPADWIPPALVLIALVLGWALAWVGGQRRLTALQRHHEEILRDQEILARQVQESSQLEQLRWQGEMALERQAAAQREALAEQRRLQLETNLRDALARGGAELCAAREEQRKATVLAEQWRERAERAAGDSRALQARVEVLTAQFAEQTVQMRRLDAARETLQAALQEKVVQAGEMETRLRERETHFQEQMRWLQENRELLRQEFESLSHRIFEAKGQAFTEQNRVSLESLLRPFRDQLGEFRLKVEDLHEREVRQKAELSAELQHLKSLNLQMSREAHELSTALRGQKKTQGNWGELVLENVLDRSGLRAGKDYQREVSFTTADGRRRPDVIINLPQGRHLVIDAKVSLNAYQDYINAEDEVVAQARLRDHVEAMSSRIRELSAKRYHELPGLSSPELVFMFVPVESAFVEALKADADLFQRALQSNVLVATPTTLLTSLNIVRQLWRFEEQNRHSAELAERAARFHDKLRLFLDSLNAIGQQLEKAQESWHKAFAQLTTGKGNLISQALDFRELGVAVKVELADNFAAQARLELAPTAVEEDRPDGAA